MATPPEYIPQQQIADESHLTLIDGGQTPETVSRFGIEVPSLVILFSQLSEASWEDMGREELEQERALISEFRARLSEITTEVYLADSAALEKMVWLNGMIRDRPPTSTDSEL